MSDSVWIKKLTPEEISVQPVAPYGPLRGLTFAIKDNIDLENIPTTAACPGFAYTPASSAHVVEKLLAAGAAPIGKTNLDQFATGLVGTRSPYGVPGNVFNPEYIAGGSSSGSAIAVARGEVDFALGTDTAGSGRVPAALNGIFGLKPTRGRLSTRGVVPACRSLDCVTIFARTLEMTARAFPAAEGFDDRDPFSRRVQKCSLHINPEAPRIGVPRDDQLEWFGNREAPVLFAAELDRWRAQGAEIIPVDFSPFLEAAQLLYGGPWTAERYAAVGAFLEENEETAEAKGIDPTVSKIILKGKMGSAVEAFRASYRLAELRRASERVLETVDVLLAPTVGTVYKISEVSADPVQLNSNLGRYNNFMNLLDLCGLTMPAGNFSSGPGFGVTLIAPAWSEAKLLTLGGRRHGETLPKVATNEITLAVCGAHLRGQPLHTQLTALGARFLSATRTAPTYRLYALANTTPPKPGLVHAGIDSGGASIAVETYALTPEAFGVFVANVPSPLVIGTAMLEDGTEVKSFLCEPRALIGAEEITQHGGWLAWKKMRSASV